MAEQIPIPEINAAERAWLENIYTRNLEGERFTGRDVWSVLYGKIPDSFHPKQMDQNLVSMEGEKIKLLGVVAIQKNRNFLNKTNRVINAIKSLLIVDASKKDVMMDEVRKKTRISNKEISLIMQLANDYSFFFRGAASKTNTLSYDSISVEGDGSIFYNYLNFPGIEKLIEFKLAKEKATQKEYFTFTEQLEMVQKIDLVLEDLSLLKEGQKFIYAEVMEQLEDMKNNIHLPKANWWQMLKGKMIEMLFSGVIDETISKRIGEALNPMINNLLSYLK